MRRNCRLRILLLLISAAVYFCAVGFCDIAAKDASTARVVLDWAVNAQAVDQMLLTERQADAPMGFCFWGAVERQTVSCPQTGKTVPLTAVFLSGNPELMESGILAWRAGCLVDEETAVTLFGTADCGEQILSYNGKTYPVLGTVSALRPTLITMAQTEDGYCLDRCVLAVPMETAAAMGEQFLLRHQLQGRILNDYPAWALTNNLLLLFPGILLLSISRRLGSGWRKLSLSRILSGRQMPLLGRTVLALGLTVLTVSLLGRQIMIPDEMIPSRWSDFSFWETLWTSQKQDLIETLFCAPGNGQLQMRLNMIKSMLSSITAALLALWAARRDCHADIAD